MMNENENMRNISVLNENFYWEHKKDLSEVDNLFQKILDMSTELGIPFNQRKEALSIFKEIQKIVGSIFNIKLKLALDFEREQPINLAYTIPTKESINEVYSDLETIVIKKEEGYSYIKLKEVYVFFESIAFGLFSHPESFKSRGIDIPVLTGRNMTAILLHEIGHNVFLVYSYNPKGKELKFYNTDNWKEEKPFILDPETDVIDSELRNVQIGAILAPITFFTSLTIAVLSASSSNYLRQEKYANTLPIQYGYAEEVYVNAVFIHKLFNDNTWYKKILDKINWNLKGYQYFIKKGLIRTLTNESKDPNNSSYQRKYALELIDRLKNVKKQHKTWI